MALILGTKTVDTVSFNGTCRYDPKVVKGYNISPNVYFEGKKVEYLPSTVPPDTVEGRPWIPNPVPPPELIPCPIPVAERKVVPIQNKTVHINGLLPLVQGDQTILTSFPGTPRKFVAPFQHPTIHIANSPV
jgi:hypothetical protein